MLEEERAARERDAREIQRLTAERDQLRTSREQEDARMRELQSALSKADAVLAAKQEEVRECNRWNRGNHV